MHTICECSTQNLALSNSRRARHIGRTGGRGICLRRMQGARSATWASSKGHSHRVRPPPATSPRRSGRQTWQPGQACSGRTDLAPAFERNGNAHSSGPASLTSVAVGSRSLASALEQRREREGGLTFFRATIFLDGGGEKRQRLFPTAAQIG